MKNKELCCEINGECYCQTNVVWNRDHVATTPRCKWFCKEHGHAFQLVWNARPSTYGKCGRVWEFGRLYPAGRHVITGGVGYKNAMKGYVPRRDTIPHKFMVKISVEGPQRGKEAGKDKQPPINLKKAGYVRTTKQGYVLTAKGRRYLNEVS